ncbi:MAG: leucine-rich repeat protein [Oscillospiraceae bacterium]|jgi:hypothetical protein|nr:leucine-rich repeat protein [Oscillospiraceae bacterium]
MKKLTLLLLAALLLIAVFAPITFAATAPPYGVVGKYTSGVYTYNLINNGKEVRIEHSTKAKGALTIPAKIANKPVTQIGTGAFATRAVTSVKIPEGVKSISANAFDTCTSLSAVTLPSTLTSIGTYAFCWCVSLGAITLPAKLKTLGASAFAGSGLTKITLPSGLTSIPASCFESCDSLKNVSVPGTVKSIGALALAGCGQLSTLTLPQGTTTVASNAFKKSGKLKNITINTTIGAGQKYTLPNYAAVKAANWKGGNTSLLKKTSGVTYQGMKTGKATYYVTDGEKRKLTVNVTVKAAPTKIVYKKTAVTLKKGATYATAVTITPSGAQGTRTYTSANVKIAKVDGGGKITAVAKGKTTITVKTYNGKTAKFTVTVK